MKGRLNVKQNAPIAWIFGPLAGAALGVFAVGCSDGITTIIWPADAGPDASADDGGTGEQSDAGADSGEEDAGPSCGMTCAGECVPWKPLEGDALPVLLYLGPDEGSAPPCPAAAPAEQLTGHADLIVPEGKCPSCTCGPSTGACGLPTSITAHAAPCNQGGIATPSDPPAAWDGTCAADNAIPAGLTCGPKGVPCVQSVTVGAMSVIDESCMPQAPTTGPEIPSPTWATFGRACGFDPCDAGHLCVRSAPEGFRQCVAWPGDHACPDQAYPDRVVLYETFTGERACTECQCGAPEGGYCTSMISLFADDACGVPLPTVGAWSVDSKCVEIAPYGAALGAKSATPPIFHAGTCQATGGELAGSIEPSGPTTFCCEPL
jgi:hypothetical protein